MFLKRLKLTNYRKFSTEQNVVEFISSKIVKKQEDENAEETVTVFPALFFYPKAGGRRLKH